MKKKYLTYAVIGLLLGLLGFAAIIFKLNIKINNLSEYATDLEIKLEELRNDSNNIVVQKRGIGGNVITYNTDSLEEKAYFYQLKLGDHNGGAGMAVKTSDNKLILIDGGYREDADAMEAFIKEQGGHVDAWILTHPHDDHVGCFVELIDKKSDITIDTVIYNGFTKEFFEACAKDKELAHLNNDQLFHEFETIRTGNTNMDFVELKADDELYIGNAFIHCLYSFKEDVKDVNSNSLVMYIEIKGVRFLITGDATDLTLYEILYRYGYDSPFWNVDICQIPHHGYLAGITNDNLYRYTTPQFALLDCSRYERETDFVNIKEHIKWIEALDIHIIPKYEGDNVIEIN